MPSFYGTVGEPVPEGLRLDRYVAEYCRLLSRSQIKARSLAAKINGKAVKLSRPVQTGDVLELSWDEAEPVNLVPEDIALDIVYEDERAVVINKPQGMVVHPGAGIRRGTLANALYFRRRIRAGVPEPSSLMEPLSPLVEPGGLRPGIVHRLDKDTSGIIIAAYDDEALAFLAAQFKARKAKKTYLALVSGVPREGAGRIQTLIARDRRDRKRFAVSGRGKAALTFYKVVQTWQGHSLLLLSPRTGRTHQLRVHLRYLGHPIVGDPLYGFADPVFPSASLMLHAKSLAITLPGENSPRLFRSPMPARFTAMIQTLNSSCAGARK
ncbi:MAG: RluA family pseudouridine synthase [Spirochaetaceae bacterium]|jgi:23S rRNA pseudouridine1911/1915/1917 synthase|nr:RluA family pseudouridine synthase [Spirochaetaceae bacterium]